MELKLLFDDGYRSSGAKEIDADGIGYGLHLAKRVLNAHESLISADSEFLAENNFAQKNRYRINDNQELLAFSLGNFAAALTGCCPINGSVSRTAMGEQYQGKTQLTGIVAGISMMILLLCGTGFFRQAIYKFQAYY